MLGLLLASVKQLFESLSTQNSEKVNQYHFYSAQISDCTETSCSGDIVQAESSLFPDFNRTFTWDLKVVSTRAFQLDFQETGMRQIHNEETCPDGHTYLLVTYLRSGPAEIGTFCKGGTVTTILIRRKGRVSLNVPGDRKLDPVDFKLSVGPETSCKYMNQLDFFQHLQFLMMHDKTNCRLNITTEEAKGLWL